MRYQEFLYHLKGAGLSVKEFAELVGMKSNSISNYAKRGHIPSHLAIIALLMHELADQDVDFRDTIRSIDAKPKKPRGATAADQGSPDLFS